MKSIVAEITAAIAQIKGNQFASLTYLTKKTKEIARYTVNLGFSYHTAILKSVTELEILMAENKDTWTSLQKVAAEEVMASLKETIAAHAEGRQNKNYTKAGQYIPIGNGLNLNTTDNTIQLFGLLHTKVTLVAGEHKTVKSAPLTIEKNKIRKLLSVSKFREFALDVGNIEKVKVKGDTIEMIHPVDAFKDVGYTVNQPTVNVGADAAAVLVVEPNSVMSR